VEINNFEIECKQTIEAYKVTICFLYNESTTILFKANKHKLINKNECKVKANIKYIQV